MNYTIEEIPTYPIAYMRRTGAYGERNALLMLQLKQWAANNNLMNDTSFILGIAHDNPEITPTEKCRYDCAITLPGSSHNWPNDTQVEQTLLHGGKYIVFNIAHTTEAVAQTWQYIMGTWLPQSKYELDRRACFERYNAKQATDDPEFCDICVPIK